MRFNKLYRAIKDYLDSTGIVGPNSVDMAIDPDAVIQWPSRPVPFLLVVPMGAEIIGDEPDDIGGGRFAKHWSVNVDIHVVVGNVLDPSYTDTVVVVSDDQALGPYEIVHAVIDKMEQADLYDADGLPTVVEKPRSRSIGKLFRFKTTSQYVSIPITFYMTLHQDLPSTDLDSMMPFVVPDED